MADTLYMTNDRGFSTSMSVDIIGYDDIGLVCCDPIYSSVRPIKPSAIFHIQNVLSKAEIKKHGLHKIRIVPVFGEKEANE